MQNTGKFALSLAFLGAVAAAPIHAAPVTPPKISGYVDNTYTFGLSGGAVHSDTNFEAFGHARDTTGIVCADGTVNLWGTGRRYAGEFSGFKIAAAGSLCQGFGTASETLGAIDGKTTLGTFMSGGGRLIVPMGMDSRMIMPHIGAGVGFGNVKVEAAPFERDRSWTISLETIWIGSRYAFDHHTNIAF